MLYLAFAALFLVLWGCFYAALPALKHATAIGARLFARWTVRISRFRPYLPIALTVVIGGFVIAWAGDQFLDLAEAVHSNNTRLADFDTLAHAWAVSKRTAGDTSFFVLMTNLGSPVAMAAIAIAVAVALIVTKRFRWLLYFAVTVAGGSLLNMELKRFFARARPAVAEMLRQAHGYSFPSGHAMGSTVVLGAVSYLAFRTATQWRWKAAWLALAWTLILSIALSRVYLGVHWISDVAAGIVAGALWVAVTTMSYEAVRRIRHLRSGRVSGS